MGCRGAQAAEGKGQAKSSWGRCRSSCRVHLTALLHLPHKPSEPILAHHVCILGNSSAGPVQVALPTQAASPGRSSQRPVLSSRIGLSYPLFLGVHWGGPSH